MFNSVIPDNTLNPVALLFIFTLFIVACAPPPPPESQDEKLAKSLCACTAKLLELNKQAQSNTDSLAFRNIALEFEKTKECVSKLGIKPQDRAGLELVLKPQCPNLAANPDLFIELLGPN